MKSICILSSVHIALDNRIFYREARSLSRAGYNVTLIAAHDRDEVIDGVQILALPRVPRWKRPFLWFKLLQMARRTQADAYHFHDPELLLVTPILRLLSGKPTVYDIHEVYADFIQVKEYMPTWVRNPIAWIFSWLEPLLTRLQSGLIFADDQIAASFANINLPKVTLFNFPAAELIEAGAAMTVFNTEREPIIIYLGGLKRNRGTSLMMEAFETVLHHIPDARLHLVGPFIPPSLEQEVRQDATARHIAHAVIITGIVPFDTIGDYLKQAQVGWVPLHAIPKYEKNIPTKIFEYMAYAVPIVSSDLMPTRPFIKNELNGYRIPANKPDEHAQAILSLLRNPQKAQQMGKNGQKLVREQYNWKQMENRLLNFYETLGLKLETP